ALVASGVISRGANPVPPVVRMRLSCFSSLHSRSVPSISSRSSGIIAPALMTASGSCVTIARIFSPLVSCRAPFAPLSLMVRTPIVIIRECRPPDPGLSSCCELPHKGANLSTRTEKPDSILIGQLFHFDLALHLLGQFTRDVQ